MQLVRNRFGVLRPAIAGVVVASLAACGSAGAGSASTTSAVATPNPMLGTPMDVALPPAVLNARLVTSTGATTTLARQAGKIVVLSDTMTLCAETCPLDTSSVVQSARDQAANAAKVVYLSVTVDPTRDTVPQIAAYRALFSPVPQNWTMATGDAATLATVWKNLGVQVQKTKADEGATNWRTGKPLTYDIQHSDQVYFIDGKGHIRFVLDGSPAVKASAIPTTLQKYLDDEGEKNLASPDPQTWTAKDADTVVDWLLAS